MNEKSIKQKTSLGLLWTTLQRLSSMLISFLSGVILARLLSPYDYGCIGMISIFMVLAWSFIDAGFGSALIQKKRPTQDDYSTIFWWNILMSLLMYVILYVASPLIASFYKIPLLCDVLRIQGLIFFIYALNIVQRVRLRKNMDFKILSIVSIITSIIALIVTIFLAYNGYGVWSLVAQNLIVAAIPSLFFWFYIRWRPKMVFSKKSFKELFNYGIYMFFVDIANNLGQKIQGLLIGRVYSPITMGFYSKADSTERLASTTITQVVGQVTFPLYAELQDDIVALRNAIKQLSMAIAYCTFPMMFLLMLLAEPIFVLLYSEKWIQSVPYFQTLCFAGLAYCLQSVNYQSISAIGKSKILFVWTMIKRGVGIGFVVVGLLLFGMKGLLIGVVLNTWFSYFVNISLVSKYIGYRWFNQLKDISPMFIVSIIASTIAYLVGTYLNYGLFVTGVVELVTFLFIYSIWTIVFKPHAFVFIKDNFMLFINKGTSKKR